MFKFKHIFLVLVLAMFGVMSLPATAAESNGRLFCDWCPKAGFQPTMPSEKEAAEMSELARLEALKASIPNTSVQKTPTNLSQEEAAAIAEVDAFDEHLRNKSLSLNLVAGLLLLLGLGLYLFGAFTKNFRFVFVGTIFFMVATSLYIQAKNFSPEEREKRVAAEKEEIRIEQLREIKRNVMRREPQRRAGVSGQ